jgi:hypothetical protein
MAMKGTALAFLVVAVALSPAVPRVRTEEQQPTEGLEFSAVPVEEHVLRGAPVFFKATLHNKSNRELHLWLADRRLRQAGWRVEVAAGKEEPFRPVRMYQMTRDFFLLEPTVVLAPGQQIQDYLIVWFGAYGDVPEERALVFSPSGEFLYRIVLGVVEGLSRRQTTLLRMAAEGKVTVSGKEVPGLTPFVRCVREVIEDRDYFVAHENRARLETLIQELGDSPYAKYAKWLWIRSIFLDGQDDEGRFALNGPRQKAREDRERFRRYYKDLLAEADQPDSPILWDALAAKALDERSSGQLKEAQQTLDELERRFGTLRDSKDWHRWPY